MKLLAILFSIVLIESAISDTVDYCDPKLCPLGTDHIACESSGEFDPKCPSDRTVVDLNESDINLILIEHNGFRNKIAFGKQRGFKPATKMATMVWNDELAKLAELNVMQCRLHHDQCRNTAEFKYAGQNLGYRANSGDFEDVQVFIKKVIHGWYSEIDDAVQADIDKCCDSASGNTIGHFTQVITDRATHVGCAISRFTSGIFKSGLMACNYALTNMIGEKVYEAGPTAAECSTGKNPDFPGLCSVDEPINPNDL